MKKSLVLMTAVMFVSQFASALTVRPGDYIGHTDDGVKCSLGVYADGQGEVERIGLFWPGAFGGGIGFIPKKAELNGNILKVSGSADFGAAKAKITLANDGTPIEALMGVGAFVQLGYDIRCQDLVRKN